ncbi:MAG: bifunctional diaminohydroxyphosphoribosylaminopyrimidine deaminase/5-amino-6-(5-phosphoribosylamino)uracil reductase RibD [Proteobacteria bacterium]|nr:bifunctional diaminohydroxyphosphoribosylaminopyrimidine deaminase/5-amino-6-(5-phosphoribosylamino)uracil reductase RibD [Pseudomonadota bacterium]
MIYSDFDKSCMQRALELAERGLLTTDPNPRVGCVIGSDGVILGEGAHLRAGEPHAEPLALAAAGAAARGATAYVTLEPCNHHGRTPPCVDALLAAGVTRVVYALRDPNPRVDGSGAARLVAAGVRTECGLMEDAALVLNEGFVKRMRTGRPFVRLKTAASVDGRVALANGASQWITGEAARADVQAWRGRSSAILTTAATVIADDPRLDVRIAGASRQPLRVVLDRQLRMPPTARILNPPGKVLVFGSTDDVAGGHAATLRQRGAVVEAVAEVRAAPAGAGAPVQRNLAQLNLARLDLAQVLERLGSLQVNELLVESGGVLAGALLEQNLVDEWLLYLAPRLLGHDAQPLAVIQSLEQLTDARSFRIIDTAVLGDDLRLRLRPRAH